MGKEQLARSLPARDFLYRGKRVLRFRAPSQTASPGSWDIPAGRAGAVCQFEGAALPSHLCSLPFMLPPFPGVAALRGEPCPQAPCLNVCTPARSRCCQRGFSLKLLKVLLPAA